MDVVKLGPGLWRWTAYHEEWRQDVGSVYYETPDGVVLVDPLVPSDEETRFWEALDRDVTKAGGAVQVLVTVFWHTRSARAVLERYSGPAPAPAKPAPPLPRRLRRAYAGVRVWAPARGEKAIARRAGSVTDPFRPGDPLPGGIVALPTARANEVVYWLPGEHTLVPGDVLLGDGSGGVRLCPQSWLPERTTLADLASSLRPVLELPVERVLVSHGEPVLDDARAALGAALERV